jgi:hypothetical protein
MNPPTKRIDVHILDNDHVKRLKDPQSAGIFHLETWLPFSEAAKLDKGNANVRPASESRKPFKEMVETVEKDPASFHVKNRGITYLCEKFEYDNARRLLRVTIPNIPDENSEDSDSDRPRFGIADGGHTYDVIRNTTKLQKNLTDIEGWVEPFVRVHFIGGTSISSVEIEEVVEALNTSSQVQQYTLDEYKNRFEELKEALHHKGFDVSLIAFRENEDKEWNVREVIQRLACFLKDRWKTVQPSQLYKSTSRALDLFTNDSSREEFRKLYDVIVDVVTLPEFIQAEFSRGDAVSGKRFGGLRAVKPLKKTYVRPGTLYETHHVMDLAASLPLATAFRELLELRGDRYEWRLDPKLVFQRCAEDLYKVLASKSKTARSVTALGSDAELWMQASNIVLRAKDEMLTEQRSSAA